MGVNNLKKNKLNIVACISRKGEVSPTSYSPFAAFACGEGI